MGQFYLGYRNKIDQATLSGGSYESTLPITHLQNRILSRVARTTGTSTENSIIDITYGSTIGAEAIALIRHNISAAGRIRFQSAVASTFVSTIYDSGWLDVFPTLFTSDDVEWESDNFWSGQIDQALINAYGDPSFIHVINAGTGASGEFWRISVDDTSNSDGHLQYGRVWHGELFAPGIQVQYGAQLGWRSNTTIVEADGGTIFWEARKMRRVFEYTFDTLTQTEIYEYFNMQRFADLFGEILVIADASDDTYAFQRNFLGRFARLDPLRQPYFDRYAVAGQIEEVV